MFSKTGFISVATLHGVKLKVPLWSQTKAMEVLSDVVVKVKL